MKILALDTSCAVATVAILNDNKLMGNYYIDDKLTHSTKLMPMVASLLEELELKPEDIDVYGVSIGPGSFTGLRIGIATIKGLAFGTGKPVAGISSLMAMAYNFPYCTYDICPIIDARNAQVFNGIYRFENGNIIQCIQPRIIEIEKLVSEIKTKTVFLGDGVYKNIAAIEKNDNILIAPPHLCNPIGSSLAYGILKKVESEATITADKLFPLYLRKSQAEQEKEKNQKG